MIRIILALLLVISSATVFANGNTSLAAGMTSDIVAADDNHNTSADPDSHGLLSSPLDFPTEYFSSPSVNRTVVLTVIATVKSPHAPRAPPLF